MVGVRPLVNYQHRFDNTYLWGSYSPITGDQFVWEINGVDKIIFQKYIEAFSAYNPQEYKILVLDNAGFHTARNFKIPNNIFLLNIPPYYCPELNPCEQIWQYIKKRYRNKTFPTMEELRQWLAQMCRGMGQDTIKSITANHHYTELHRTILSHLKVEMI